MLLEGRVLKVVMESFDRLFRARAPRVTGTMIAAILAVVSSFGQSAPPATRSLTNSIEVFVTSTSGTPLTDVDVFITYKPTPPSSSADRASDVSSNARTGNDGRAIFRNLPAGNFDVRVERLGYLPVRSDAGTARSFSTSIQLINSTQPTTRQVKVTLIGGGIISGRVESPSGRPAAGVSVVAMQMRYQDGEKFLSPAVAISGTSAVTTDDRGEFRIFWLAPGDYYLSVDRSQPRGDHSYGANLFYPGVPNLSAAARVTAREGQETAGLRLVLAPPSGVKLSGTVTSTINAAGSPTVALTPEGLPHKSQWIGLSAEPNVKDAGVPLEISDVPPGNYELDALVRANNETGNRANYFAKVKLTVGSQDLRDIRVTIRDGANVDVNVSAPPEYWSYIRNQPRRYEEEPYLTALFQPQAASDAVSQIQLYSSELEGNSMQLTETNVSPGRYRLTAVRPLPPDAYIGDLKQNGQTVYDGVVVVGEAPVDVQVSIGRNGGTIQGSVTGPSLETQNYLAVVLVPDAPRRENFLLYKRQDVGSSPSDPSQFRFSFAGVAPGNYKVIAVDMLRRGSETDPDVFGRYESRAIEVTVMPGITRDIQVPLIRTR